jgi:hypothetical protein
MEVTMSVPTTLGRRLCGRGTGVLAATAALVLLAGVPAASGLSSSPSRYFQAAVNLPPDAPGAGGFAGSVSFRQVVSGPADVSVFLSRSTVVACPHGEGIASQTVRTVDSEASEPGPVTLDIDRLLRAAHGEAVVDLIVEDSPGCGAPDTSVTLPAQRVTIDTTGTSDRFRTGISGSVSAAGARLRSSTVDLSRDGVGTASVGSLVGDAAGAAFLKYTVERTLVHGTPPQAPANAAPAGGVGVTGAHSAQPDPPDGLGVVFEDMAVSARTTPRPQETTLDAFAEVHTLVGCPDGGTGLVLELVEGSGPGTLDVARRLATATATATLETTRTRVDGCEPQPDPVITRERVPVALSLTATGPAVRVRDTRFHQTRGDNDPRTHTSYLARDATGTITVGDLTRPTGLASISQARR